MPYEHGPYSRPPKRSKGRFTYAFAVGTLVATAALIGHYAGQNASARGVPGDEWADVMDNSRTIIFKSALRGTLDPDVDQAPTQTFEDEVYGLAFPSEQTINADDKGDFLASVPDSLPQDFHSAKPEDRIEPVETMIGSPSILDIERMSLRGRSGRAQQQEEQRRQVAEHRCMSRAIYFEARGESTLGQLAVANVILNRVENDAYPDTICGVVYQNEQRRNACQFSFACDGKSDEPRAGRYWDQAVRVATQAITGHRRIYAVEGATHYHADYVQPRWAGSMQYVKKIGRHIFYRDPSITGG